MRFIDITQYDYETMQLAKPVYDKMRRILLTAGRTIHPTVLKRIQDMGISTLVVEDAESEGITLDEMMDMPTWMDIVEVVQQAYEDVQNKKKLNIMAISKAVGKLILESSNHKIVLTIPTSTVSKELVDYAHAVNVTLIALQMGKKLNFTGIQLKDLAIGTLLHDIGKALSSNEEEHPQKGFEFLREIREFSLLSAHVAYQHHEIMTGEGFPRGLSGKDILDFPQVCGVANLYENLISKEKMNPNDALELIMSKSGGEYKAEVIQAFVDSIPSYLPGTKVELHSGENAIVTGIKSNLHRPIIRYMSSDKEVDLAQNPTIIISKVI